MSAIALQCAIKLSQRAGLPIRLHGKAVMAVLARRLGEYLEND